MIREATARGVKNAGEKSSEIYVFAENSPYELLMHCPYPEGRECHADVMDKKSKIQFHMIIPSEAVEHTQEVIFKIYGMLRAWDDDVPLP